MRNNQTSPIAISVTEAAALLGVSRPTLYKLLYREDFPSLRVGGRVLVSRAGLERWVEQQTEVQP